MPQHRVSSPRILALGAALALALAGPAATGATTTSGNLLSGDAATFDHSLAGWVPVSASAATVGSPTQAGAGAMSLTTTATGPVDVGALSGSSPATRTAASPGTRYTAGAWVRPATTERPVEPMLAFYDARGTTLAMAWGPTTREIAGAWTPLNPVVGVAPAGAASVAVGLIVAGTATGEVHFVDSASLTGTTGGSSSVVGPLRTSGNQILDGQGRPVVLRGVHRYGLETTVAPKSLNENDIAQIKLWGANVVRVSLGEQLWLTTSCTYDRAYAGAVDDAVRWITTRGMVALLDLHYNTITPCGAAGQHLMADAPGSVTFWSQVAARYRRNPLVAFDLYNEPHGISDAVWRDGGKVAEGGVTFQAAGMQQLYDAVRAQGARNLVVVSGTDWANSFPTTAPVAGTDIVYGAHAYTCPQVPPPGCTTTNPYDPSSLLGRWVTPAARYPVMVTEFGWPDHNDGTYLKNVIAYAESHGWGWDAFAWDASNGPFALVVGADTGAYEPSPSGMAVLSDLGRNP